MNISEHLKSGKASAANIVSSTLNENKDALVSIQDLARTLRHYLNCLARRAEYQSPARVLPILRGAEKKATMALKGIEEILPTGTKIPTADLEKLAYWQYSNRGMDYIDYVEVLAETAVILKEALLQLPSKVNKRRLQNYVAMIDEVQRIYARAIQHSASGIKPAGQEHTELWM